MVHLFLQEKNNRFFPLDKLSFCSKPSVIPFDARSQEAFFLPRPCIFNSVQSWSYSFSSGQFFNDRLEVARKVLKLNGNKGMIYGLVTTNASRQMINNWYKMVT
jgi:hypothetical protein